MLFVPLRQKINRKLYPAYADNPGIRSIHVA
ncbi:hypothetical protein WLH_00699 [Escherichia coli O25b:H4]|uniref:Uncharacterized protein n=1 Tax=Escherichia coli O25b:H4 TaxID=941280 RepID=A0A192C7T0_ECO25|nr:hypothetical protein WLH_00699 [Escherichia coli O25b:H4]KGM74488.1 hypothetical protein EL78_1626 [Escherichia coli]